MSETDWREMVSDEAMPLGFQQSAELPITEDESWTHSGCGGTVVFDMSGGFCTRCHAENLDHEIGEAVSSPSRERRTERWTPWGA